LRNIVYKDITIIVAPQLLRGIGMPVLQNR